MIIDLTQLKRKLLTNERKLALMGEALIIRGKRLSKECQEKYDLLRNGASK